MAERLNKRQAESARQLIQTQRIVQELHKLIDGEREMTSQQLRAAEILLSKSLPNLQSTELTSDDGGLTINLVSQVANKPADD